MFIKCFITNINSIICLLFYAFYIYVIVLGLLHCTAKHAQDPLHLFLRILKHISEKHTKAKLAKLLSLALYEKDAKGKNLALKTDIDAVTAAIQAAVDDVPHSHIIVSIVFSLYFIMFTNM